MARKQKDLSGVEGSITGMMRPMRKLRAGYPSESNRSTRSGPMKEILKHERLRCDYPLLPGMW